MKLQSTLGQRLRRLMQERNYTYEQLGELVGVTPQSLNRYVLGQREPKARVCNSHTGRHSRRRTHFGLRVHRGLCCRRCSQPG